MSSRSFCSSLSNTQQGLTKEGTFGRQDNSPHPKDVHVLLLRTCEYFADSADGIKDLEMGRNPGLFPWTQCHHKDPYKRKTGESERKK